MAEFVVVLAQPRHHPHRVIPADLIGFRFDTGASAIEVVHIGPSVVHGTAALLPTFMHPELLVISPNLRAPSVLHNHALTLL